MNKAQRNAEKLNSIEIDGYDDWTEYVEDNLKFVFAETLAELRWSDRVLHTYKLDDGSFLGVEFDEPATEMQDGMDCEYEFYEVEPYEVTETRYKKK